MKPLMICEETINGREFILICNLTEDYLIPKRIYLKLDLENRKDVKYLKACFVISPHILNALGL